MKGFDAETVPHASRIPGASRIVLPQVRVAWKDAAGDHDVRLAREALLGSSPSVALRIEDPLVSRLHAELSVREDGVWVRDLSSTNGTFVESVRVAEAQVPEGGRLRLGATVLRVLTSWDDAREEEAWPDERLGRLLGRSPRMRELFAKIVRVAAMTSPVLVQGETGVGKELVARTIHERATSTNGPFVHVDAATLTPETCAIVDTARGGTVFLDEIADVPAASQALLLRRLEIADVRVVAATQRDLPRLVSEGAFREDLYFRLAVLPLVVPPLRERLEDLPLLARAFLPAEEHGALTPSLLAELASRPWRGNVRELRNFVERALTFGTEEALDLLPASSASSSVREPLPKVTADEPFKVVRDRWVAHLEREYVRAVLARTGGNVSAAAEAAGLDRAYVYRLLRKHGL